MRSSTDGDGARMDTAYARYLLLVALVAAGTVVLGMLLFIAARGRKGKKRNAVFPGSAKTGNASDGVIDSGNVSVFFDRQRNAVLIPYVPDLFGSGKATDNVIWLDMPYSSEGLGRAVRSAMASCRNGKPASTTALMKLIRAVNWREFAKGRLSVSVYCRDGRNIMLNSTMRTPEGAYVYITKNPEICLPVNAEDYELGDAILGLIKRCR